MDIWMFWDEFIKSEPALEANYKLKKAFQDIMIMFAQHSVLTTVVLHPEFCSGYKFSLF